MPCGTVQFLSKDTWYLEWPKHYAGLVGCWYSSSWRGSSIFFGQLSAFTAKTLADGADESRNVCRIQSGIWTRSKPGFGTAILLTAALRHLLLSLDGCSSLGALMLGCWAWGMATSSVRFGSSTFEPWVREFSFGFENPCWNPGFDFYIRTLNSETPYSKPGVPNPGVPEPREIEYRKNCKFWTLNTNPNQTLEKRTSTHYPDIS